MNAKTKKILLWILVAAIVAAACWWILSDGSGSPADGGELRATEDVAGEPEALSGEDGASPSETPEETPDERPEDTAETQDGDGETEAAADPAASGAEGDVGGAPEISEDGVYTSRDDVAAYLWLYGHLPANFLTKNEARELGWDSSLGNLDEVAPGMSIGGDRFGNREGLLPAAPGRQYYECDIDYDGGFRNGKRIVWSNDGLIYYTEDHYNSFELLYGGVE